MKNKHILLLIFLPISALGQPTQFRKILINDENAKCLDGSPGAYYISDRGRNPNKIMLFFEGGEWCGSQNISSTIQSCYRRSRTELGSSLKYPPTMDIWDGGILSDDPSNFFNDFTKIFMKYCDGSGHQGTKSAPIQYKQTQLYFRGNNLTISKLDNLEKTLGIFSKATEILVTGVSSGGLAALTWVDYVRNRSISKNVYAVSDAGVFLDFPNFYSKNNEYRNNFENLFKISNAEIDPPLPNCVAAYKNSPHLCMFVENSHKYIQSPIFAVQSLYDSWSIKFILGINCNETYDLQTLSKCNTEERNYIQEYHRQTSRVLEQIGVKKQNGYWAIACVNQGFTQTHFYSRIYVVPMRSKNTVDLAVRLWVQKKVASSHYMDTCQWPQNKPCSGVYQPTQ